MSTPTPCLSCEALAHTLNCLMSQIESQHRLLMAFNKAGYNLAAQEVKMAELSVEKQEAETALVRAKAAEMLAEAKRTAIESGGPKPLHGMSVGHERITVGG